MEAKGGEKRLAIVLGWTSPPGRKLRASGVTARWLVHRKGWGKQGSGGAGEEEEDEGEEKGRELKMGRK